MTGPTTPCSFNIFDRDDEGGKLNKIKNITLRGDGMQIQGMEGFAMSLDILPNLQVLEIMILGEESLADNLVEPFFQVANIVLDLPEQLHRFVFECATPLMAAEQHLKAIARFLGRL